MEWPTDFINKIICGDCFEVMKEMPGKSIDLILTDLPYGRDVSYDIYKDTEKNWFNMFEQLMFESQRIATMTILPCCQIEKLPYIYQNFPPDWLICWYKGSPGHNAFIGFNDWEPLLVYGKNKGVQMHDYFKVTPESLKCGHPCPKPRAWAEWLISRTTKENDLVLDPFLGSGTTAEACKLLRRNFIGIEISPKYCKLAEERLAQGVL